MMLFSRGEGVGEAFLSLMSAAGKKGQEEF
jgi:hypothetical protein